jgi:hypothetical protein
MNHPSISKKDNTLHHLYNEGEDEEDIDVDDSSSNVNTLKTTILELLKRDDVPLNGWDTLQIAKKVIGPNATRSQVNPILYAMLNEGLLMKMKVANKQRPHWKIAQ